MGAVEIIQLLAMATKAGLELYQDYQSGKAVLSESDAKKIHAALLDAEAATAALRPLVDAALEAAANR